MNIVAIDDEKLALEALCDVIREAQPEAAVYPFRKQAELLSFAEETPIDIAFLDIELRGSNGLDLARKLKKVRPKANIVFATGYSQYALDAFGLHASGYLLKPVCVRDIRRELENLRNYLPAEPSPCKLRVQTFGNFEVFYGREPLHFGRAKTKELFAYLIDRKGAAATMAEIATILWEDKEYDRSRLNQIHSFLSDLIKLLKSVEAEGIIIKTRNSLSINVEAVDCDYYKFLQGDIFAINSFTDEYMSNYSWAEFTVGSLYRLSPQNR